MASDAPNELALVRQLKEQTKRLEQENKALKGGDGGGTFGGMESRVAKLEAHVEHIQRDLTKLGEVPTDVAAMKRDIAALPTKEYLSNQFDVQFRWITGATALIVALIGLIVKLTMD